MLTQVVDERMKDESEELFYVARLIFGALGR
jgi:hypothetical protein